MSVVCNARNTDVDSINLKHEVDHARMVSDLDAIPGGGAVSAIPAEERF